MECLACNQCVDACDEVMVKLARPTGLIHFASQTEQAGKPRQVLRPRLLVYAALMSTALLSLGVSLATRAPFEANVFRNRGANPFVIDGDTVRNAFEVHVFNKNPRPANYHLSLKTSVDAKVIIGTPDLELASLTDAHVPVMVSVDRGQLHGPVDLLLTVRDETSGVDKVLTVRFLAPPGL
jgi:polyferredoxin